jgi:outer membrane protein OmpA-like peptidoglycan-associated protein
LKPIVECPLGTSCSEEERAKNQRTEISIADVSKMPTKPDHIIEYDFVEWTLPKGADTAVFGLIRYLKENPSFKVELSGYTDTYGPYKDNIRIASLRAINIENILKANGIEKNRIVSKWYGERVPFNGCLTEYPCPIPERKQNRRVEIRLIDVNKMKSN